MYASLSVLELQHEEAFERIVRHLAGIAGLDLDDAMVRGLLADEAEVLISLRRDPACAQASLLDSDPVLTELVSDYEDLGRFITELRAGAHGFDGGTDGDLDEDADFAVGGASDRCWSDDR